MGSTENISYTQFACIGSGFSGIGLGATLQRWYGIKDFRLFERNDQVGGTWLVNKYPGAACDVPSALYSFSFESNPNWTSVLPNKDELLNYLIEVAKKYDINSHTSFNTEVERCEWIQETSRWRITACDLKTGKTFYHESQFLFAGSGQLVGPRELDIPGIETFKGAVFHSSAWRDDVDLTDKNVIVIGNGCTGNQIVPSIVGKTKHLTHLVRSKHWIVPGIETDFAETLQFVTKWIPGSMLIQRFAVYLFAERLARSVPMNKTSQRYRYTQAVKLEKFMRSRAPVEYHDMLIPDFQVGCKRRVFDSGYLDCLHRENITLTNEKGLEVVPEGIRTESRTIPADVIVLANGFKTNHMFDNIEVIGRGGETISQHWDSFGGPEAYNTTSMNGFPNFFILVGPNTLTGHTSTIMAAENSINYALRVIKPILEGQASSLEPRRGAEEDYAKWMQAELKKTVWYSGCNNWYNLKNGKGGQGWNGTTYPWSQAHFWYSCLFPNFNHWEYRGTVKPKHSSPVNRVLLMGIIAAAVAWSMKTRKTKSFQVLLAQLISRCVALGRSVVSKV